MVPLDFNASSIPAALFTFRLVNTDHYPLHGTLGASVQNVVGWDGITPIDGVHAPGYGGNTNRLLPRDRWTSVVLENVALQRDRVRRPLRSLARRLVGVAGAGRVQP